MIVNNVILASFGVSGLKQVVLALMKDGVDKFIFGLAASGTVLVIIFLLSYVILSIFVIRGLLYINLRLSSLQNHTYELQSQGVVEKAFKKNREALKYIDLNKDWRIL